MTEETINQLITSGGAVGLVCATAIIIVVLILKHLNKGKSDE